MAGAVSKEAIDFLTRQIRKIEKVIEEKVELRGTVSISFDVTGGGEDLGVDDHVGDGADRPICQGGQLCVLLSEGFESVVE